VLGENWVWGCNIWSDFGSGSSWFRSWFCNFRVRGGLAIFVVVVSGEKKIIEPGGKIIIVCEIMK
jgi:hypothetical protein